MPHRAVIVPCELRLLVSYHRNLCGKCLNNSTLLLLRTGPWAVQANKKVELFRPPLCLPRAEARDSIHTKGLNLEVLNRKVTHTHTHTHTQRQRRTHTYTDTHSHRPDFARIRESQHMCAAVCSQPLYLAIARFVSKKSLGDDAQGFRMLIRRSVNRQRNIPVSFQNGVHEIIVF